MHLYLSNNRELYLRPSDTGYVDNNNVLNYSAILQSTDPSFTNNIYYRPKAIPQWYSVNTRFVYKISEDFTIGFMVNNIFNTHQTLIKPYNTPFDYIREGRAIYFDLNLTL
jgi:outer membrane cobalamin receptor